MPSLSSEEPEPEPSHDALIKRLLALGWRYRWRCVTVLALQIVLLALGLASLGLSGLGIDVIRHAVQPDSNPPHWPLGFAPPAGWSTLRVITVIAAAILVAAVVRSAVNYVYSITLGILIHLEIVVDLRGQVYDKLQRLSFRFFDANASGSIINRVTSDVQLVRSFVDGVLIQSVILVLSLVVYLVYMLSIHPLLTVVCLATTPLLWFVSVWFSRRVRPLYAENRELFDRMVLKLSESVQGIQVVKSFAREREEIAQFNQANDAVRDQQRTIFQWLSFYSPTIGLLSQISLVVLLGYGGYLVIHGQIPLGTGLVVFAGLLQQFSGQVTNIATIANTVEQSLTGARRVFEVLDAPIEVQSPASPKRIAKARGEVRFEHVWFEHKVQQPVLQDIDFTVQPGQCIALLGATGAGKSVLLSLLPRFYDPTRGRLLLDGNDLRELDLDELRRNIGIVFQESFLFSNTVAANIAFGHPNTTPEQIERAARIAQAHEFIVKLPKGYETVLGEAGSDLSGGQRQRLAIARALLLEPSILILDDPTAAIDPETEHEILEAMGHAMKGRTTFVVAHRLSTLRRADMILVMDDGRIVQRGTHDELMKLKGHYQQAATIQFAQTDRERREGGAGL